MTSSQRGWAVAAAILTILGGMCALASLLD